MPVPTKPNEQNKYHYYAFISYSHKKKDKEYAKLLYRELEDYKLPNTLNGRTDLPKEIRPVFKDDMKLKSGNLPQQIHDALEQSRYLIVVCSPHSAHSDWVNLEVETFISMGRVNRVIPFIIDGYPHAKNDAEECYPKAIRGLPKEEEILGANINETGGFDVAVVKVVAQMFDLELDNLWSDYEQRKKRIRRYKFLGISIFAMIAIAVTAWIWHQNVEIKDKNWKMMENQSRFVAEKAKTLIDTNSYLSSLLAIDILPIDLINPQRPYTPEAEFVLRQSMTRPMVILGNHNASIKTVDVSSDGNFVLSASADGTIKIWDIRTGTCKQTLQLNTLQDISVRCARFSKDDKYVVSALSSNSIMIWDVSSGRCLDTLIGHSNQVWYAVFSGDGKQIASASVDRTIKIWDVDKNSCIRTLKGHKLQVNSVEYNHDGTCLVSASMDKTIKLWDLNTDSCLRTLKGHIGSVKYAVFSPDGKHIASASSDSTIRIWDSNTGLCNDTVLRHCSCVNSVKYSLDGNYLVSASEDTIKLWDVKTKKCIQAMKGHSKSVSDVDFCPNSKLLVSCSGDRTIRIWNIAENNPIVYKVSASPTDCYAKYSSDGRCIAYQIGGGVSKILDLEADSSIFSTQGIWGRPSFAYHERLLATISNSEDSIYVWDIESNFCQFTITDLGKLSKSLAFSPDGNRLACYSDNGIRGSIAIIDIHDSHHKKLLDNSSGYEEKITYSPNGNYLCAQKGSIIRVWNAITGNCVLDYERKQMRGFAFHPCDNVIVIGSGVGLIIVDIKTGKEIRTLDELSGFTNFDGEPCFSSDGKYLISNSGKTIYIRDYKSGFCVNSINVDTSVSSVEMSPNGRCILAGLYDGTINIWDFPPLQDLIDQTRERFKDRPLTSEERRMYYLE